MKLDLQVSTLNRVGATLTKRLQYLGTKTIRDLLFYFPFRYEDVSEVKPIGTLRDADQVTVRGKIELIANRRSPRQRKIITEAVVSDGSEQLKVVWFGQPFLTKNLHVGDEVYLSGKVKEDMFGLQLVSPAYEKVSAKTTHTARIVPLYHLTAGITQKQIRFLMKQALEVLRQEKIDDWIPTELLKANKLVHLYAALQSIHFPESSDDLRIAERRLKFDELFILQLRAEMIRQSLRSAQAPRLTFQQAATKAFVERLPFALTKDQKIAAWEILQDLEKDTPMNRLLEGDVGSGKTVVAGIAMHSAVINGTQSVLLAPTEILARQHFETLRGLFAGRMNLALFTRSHAEVAGTNQAAAATGKKMSKKALRAAVIDQLGSGEIEMVVGTHALLSEAVMFHNVGLVVVDEQHRFGVAQRKTIREQSGAGLTTPHFLSMTATPIPRSFALTLYGDLDISIIKTLPAGRKPVKTKLFEPSERPSAYGCIRRMVQEGRQAFVICPLIDQENSKTKKQEVNLEKKSVLAEYEKLSTRIFPDLRVGYLHGKLKAAEKEATMSAFVNGSIDILVATSVVEVGVDIPNASVMLIEGADRFGLAQLHQFRGRVGRSEHQSYCFVFSDSTSQSTRERLRKFCTTTDGFALAEYDLHSRGPGEVYGTSQSGMMQLRLSSMRDVELIKLTRDTARGIDFEQYPTLREKVAEWEETVHLE